MGSASKHWDDAGQNDTPQHTMSWSAVKCFGVCHNRGKFAGGILTQPELLNLNFYTGTTFVALGAAMEDRKSPRGLSGPSVSMVKNRAIMTMNEIIC